MSKTNLSLEQQFQDVISDFRKQHFEATQEALEELATDVARALAGYSPRGSGSGVHFQDSWTYAPYKNVKYVHNERLSRERIPVSNLIEYNRKNTPFIARTWETLKPEIQRKFVIKMQQKLK